MKIKLTFITSLLMLSILAYAQENSIKVYSNFLVLNSALEPRHTNFEKSLFAYNNLSLAFQNRQESGKSNEFEFYTFVSRGETEMDQFRQFDIHLRYERGRYLSRLSFNKGQVMIAGSGKLFYLNEYIEPKTTNDFPTINNSLGGQLSAIIRMELALTKRIFFDVNYNFFAISMSQMRSYKDIPTLTGNQKTNGGFDIDFGGVRLLRIGLGVKLNKSEVAVN